MKAVDEGSFGLYFLGERREITGLTKGFGRPVSVEGTSTTIVVPPGDSPGGGIEPAMPSWLATASASDVIVRCMNFEVLS